MFLATLFSREHDLQIYNRAQWYRRIVQKCTADRAMERVPLHDREMEISIQYHVMLIRQSNDQILMRCYII